MLVLQPLLEFQYIEIYYIYDPPHLDCFGTVEIDFNCSPPTNVWFINSDVVVENGIYSTLNDLQSIIGRASCCLC